MYLVVHSAIGAALTAGLTTDPVAAFGIGWLSHYFADLIPHGDEQAGEWARRKNEIRRYLLLAGIDGLLVLILVLVQAVGRGFSPALLAAVCGSVLPDVMWGLEKLFRKNLFGPLQRFHFAIHNYFRVRLPLWFGLLFQAALAGGLWFMLIRH